MPKLSVVIPLYNKQSYIEETLQSVITQSFNDFEIIVVNDCSTDKSLDLVLKVEDSRLKIIEHKKNKGLSAARNTGIKNAETNYITFIDADDLWKPDFLKTINFLIETYPDASIYATKYEVLLNNNKTIEYSFPLGIKEHGLIDNFYKKSKNQSIYNHSCVCFKKEVFEEVGNYNETINFSEDIDFMIRAHEERKLAYHTKPLSIYRMDSENQITQAGFQGKKLPDYNFYENHFSGRNDIKEYLDFHRYVKAKLFKLFGDKENFLKMSQPINLKNLTSKQRFLLKSPRFLLKFISSFKLFLRNLGFNITSY